MRSALTTAELKKIWNEGSTVKTWKDVRSDWPAEEIKLFGPGADSGTFDFFTKEINGEEGVSRTDYSPSEDDNVLVQGVSNEKSGLGYFGYNYFAENTDKLKALGVDSGQGCVEPSEQSIKDESYKPLSRPLFIYISNAALARTEVQEFAKFYLDTVNDLFEAGTVKYVSLPTVDFQDTRNTLTEAIDAAG